LKEKERRRKKIESKRKGREHKKLKRLD